MKILMLVNWKIHYLNKKPDNIQPPDYYVKNEKYWFFKYWPKDVEVDVVDISSIKFIEKFEKNIFRFYIIQTLKILPRLKNYDLVISHGAQSGIFLSFIRKLFKLKYPPHIVFDIGSFNSAKETGKVLKFMQYASKSINALIYHTSTQRQYYDKFYPWLVKNSIFIPFGTDIDYFNDFNHVNSQNKFILCVGYAKRDWDTLIKAFLSIDQDKVSLKIIGKNDLVIDDSRIILVPFIPIKNLIDEIKKSLFIVLPLKEYNYSYGQMTLLQSMALGKAVIVSKVSSMIDYVDDGENAIFYESGNLKQLRQGIKLLLGNYDLINTIGTNARNSVIQKYSEQEMSMKIYHFCKSIIDKYAREIS